MADTLTFNAETLVWQLDSNGLIEYAHSIPHTGHSTGPYPAGPYDVIPEQVPFDPIHETGGTFWKLVSGPDSGGYVSAWTNSLGYGDITVVSDYTPPANPNYPTINPLADWRILIKGLGDGVETLTNNLVTINEPTNRYSRTTAGIISATPLPRLKIPAGGPYKVNPVVVPFDPIWGTGGSFWRMVDGPYPGWLLSKWTNTLSDDFGPYGDITISQDSSFGRGPGALLATLYHPNAHLAGFSINHNAPGELHFTLLVDDPNVGVIVPKQCHATVEFYDGASWVEVWAGVVWDIDATDTEVVYYGIDYLGMLQYCVDERFNPAFPKKAAPTGSWYAGKTIKQIVDAQLDYSIGLSDSWVGWIARGATDAMSETIAGLPSTFAQTLPFVVGLIDSHRAGTGKNTRISVKKTISDTYEFVIEDDPGVNQDGKMIRYGSLAQGYRIVKFGQTWASRVNVIARMVDGVKVEYKSDSSGVDQKEWGRVAQEPIVIETMDKNDLNRRVKQAALDSARMGRQIGIGLKLGSFRPLDDYDVCDNLPIEINHGGVDTKNWASDVFGADDEADPSTVMANYWTILGISWESFDDGHWMTNLSLFPKGGGAFTEGLDTADPIVVPTQTSSGYGAPPAGTTSNTYTDLNTGVTYERNDDTEVYDVVAGTGSVVDFDFTSSTSWVIEHTMLGYPNVTLRDTAGKIIEADVVYTDNATITVTLSSAQSGSAHLG